MAQQETVIFTGILKAEMLQKPGGRDHVSVKIILKFIQRVDPQIRFLSILQQFILVRLLF